MSCSSLFLSEDGRFVLRFHDFRLCRAKGAKRKAAPHQLIRTILYYSDYPVLPVAPHRTQYANVITMEKAGRFRFDTAHDPPAVFMQVNTTDLPEWPDLHLQHPSFTGPGRDAGRLRRTFSCGTKLVTPPRVHIGPEWPFYRKAGKTELLATSEIDAPSSW